MRTAADGNNDGVCETSKRQTWDRIRVEDFDWVVNLRKREAEEEFRRSPEFKPYNRPPPDVIVEKMMEEAELRRREFCKLLDEHDALVEKLKRIETQHSNILVSNKASITS